MHWHDIDLRETTVARGVEGGEPVAVGECDGRGEKLCIWVWSCEYWGEGGGGVLGGGQGGESLERVVGFVEETEISGWRGALKHGNGGSDVGGVHG